MCCHGFYPSLPSLPLSSLHCAGPVTMVTALSDRWSLHRYGVSPPTPASYPPPPWVLLSPGLRVSPSPWLSPLFFVRQCSVSDCLLQIYSKADNKLERGFHLLLRRSCLDQRHSIVGLTLLCRDVRNMFDIKDWCRHCAVNHWFLKPRAEYFCQMWWEGWLQLQNHTLIGLMTCDRQLISQRVSSG